MVSDSFLKFFTKELHSYTEAIIGNESKAWASATASGLPDVKKTFQGLHVHRSFSMSISPTLLVLVLSYSPHSKKKEVNCDL